MFDIAKTVTSMKTSMISDSEEEKAHSRVKVKRLDNGNFMY